MEMRNIGRLGVAVSRLGMGCMRLPTLPDGKIDQETGNAMIDALLEGGVNFFDTAYFYHGGESEHFVRRALVERHPREQYLIADKLPLDRCKVPEDCEKIFNDQCGKLGTDRIDLYHLHGIAGAGWERAKELGAHEMQKRLKREGKVRFIGFSFHGPAKEIVKILDEGEWDFVQIQLNYVDWTLQDAAFLYHELQRRGIASIAMEPVRGSGLSNLHPEAKKVLAGSPYEKSPAALALRWCQSLPHLDIVLSGMSTPAQVGENVAIFRNPLPFTDEDRGYCEAVLQALQALPLIPCTDCRYCIECPQGINIPQLFGGYNDNLRFGADWGLKMEYLTWTPEEKRVPSCIECGQCEDKCPQGIAIIRELKKVHEKALTLK